MTLGEKLKELRLERKMTLHDVAEKTGYSKALISRIESDSVSPSLTSLIKIAAALEFSLRQLFAAIEGSRVSVVKKNERESRLLAGKKIRVENLCRADAGGKMEALIKTFESKAGGETRRGPGGAEQWWHMLKGKLELVAGGEVFELSAGDSIYLSSSVAYKVRNAGAETASALVVTTPPGT